MKHERRMMQRVLCGLVLFGCLGLLWTAGAGVEVSTPAYGATATGSTTSKADLGAAKAAPGLYTAGDVGVADEMNTTDRTGAEMIRATVEATQPAGQGRVVWDQVKETNPTKFTGRAAGWGANYTVEGEEKPTSGPGAGTSGPKLWYSYFRADDKPRIVLEINEQGDGDNSVLLGVNTGALKLKLISGVAGTRYTPSLTCTGHDGENGDVTFGTVPTLTTTSPEGSVDLTGTNLGKMKISGTCPGVPAVSGGVPVIPVDGQVIGLTLDEATFSAVSGRINPVFKDDGTSWPAPAAVHWKRDRGEQIPVCYTRNSRMKIEVKFVCEVTRIPVGTKIQVCGANAVSTFDWQELVVGAGGVLQGTFEAQQNIPNEIDVYEPLITYWYFAFDTGDDILRAGRSENYFYVTLGNPDGSLPKLFQTLLHIGCNNAQGKTDPDQVITEVWKEFENRYVTRVDGQLLTYYANYATGNLSTSSLLANADGQCGSWASLFLDTLKAHNINHTNEYIIFQPTNSHGFLVNSWNTPTTGISTHPSYPYLNILDSPWIGAESYNFKYAQVTDQRGIPGQGNSDPASLFNNHQIVKLNGTYYDPSYGAEYATFAAVRNSLSAFYVMGGWRVDEANVSLDLNSDGDMIDTGVLTGSLLSAEPTTDTLVENSIDY